MKTTFWMTLCLVSALLFTSCSEKPKSTQNNERSLPWYASTPLPPSYNDPLWMGLLFYTGGAVPPYFYPYAPQTTEPRAQEQSTPSQQSNRDNGEIHIYRDTAALNKESRTQRQLDQRVEVGPGPHESADSSKAVHAMQDIRTDREN